MIKMGVRALHTHKRRKHWCALHGYNLPVIMILLGVSKRAVAKLWVALLMEIVILKPLSEARVFVYHLSINGNKFLINPFINGIYK